MTESNPNDNPQLTGRVVTLEELFTHLQATVQTLSDEVFAQSRRIDALERQSVALKTQLAAATAALREERSLEDEKPPHY